MKIYLIRHGQKTSIFSSKGERGISLKELGKKQAQKAGEFLKNSRISKIVTSPFRRTTETTQYMNKELSLPVIEDADIVEIKPLPYIRRALEIILGIENKKEENRVRGILSNYMAEKQDIILSTHGGTIRYFCSYIAPKNKLKYLLSPYFNTGITIINENLRIEDFNLSEHLEENEKTTLPF